MNAPKKETDSDLLPQARIRSRKWGAWLVWIVPVVALLAAGYLVYHRVREYGATITIEFREAEGLKPGQTMLLYRGIAIGEVTSVDLSKDQKLAVVQVKLRRSAASVAKDGSIFWIVRPELEMGSFTGLGTLFAGPHLEVLPGHGEVKSSFAGVERSPLALEPQGLKLTLRSTRAGSLRAGAPVYYRGIDVGAVQQSQLSSDATSVEVLVVIRQRYAKLVQSNSRFWNVTGLDVKFGIFRGAEINVESLKSLLIGGVAFATPNEAGNRPVTEGAVFPLHDEVQKEWLEWAPPIALPPADSERPSKEKAVQEQPAVLQAPKMRAP